MHCKWLSITKNTATKKRFIIATGAFNIAFQQYTQFATSNGMVLSTTEKYDPYENAVAERINQTLKYEFGLIRTIPSLEIANKMLQQAVDIYNNERRHRSIEMQTPGFAHTHTKHHKYRSYKMKAARNVDKVEKIP